MEKCIKLYVVDDEKMAIEYLKKLIEGISPACKVVGEALHGPTALEEIPKVQPDIVFIDISMPIMNGLDLAEKILKHNRNQMIVFLTSYREFDYVKRGMEIGVGRYLLKNELTSKSLEIEIQGIVEQMTVEKRKIHMYQEYNLKQFLESESSKEEEMLEVYKGSGLNRFALVVIKMICPITTKARFPEHVHFDTICLEELRYPEGIACRGAVRMSEELWASILFIRDTVAESTQLLEIVAKKMLSVYMGQEMKVSVIISNATKKFMALPQEYNRIVRLAQHMICMGEGMIYKQRTLENQLTGGKRKDFYMSDLMNLLDTQSYTEAVELTDKLFEETRSYTIQEFTRIFLDLHGVIRRYAIRRKVDINLLPVQEEFYSVEEVKLYTRESIFTISRHLQEQEKMQYSRNVLLILEYIHKHYAVNLSLQDIAEAVQLSEGHTRKCFKQEVGITVVDYLTEYRIRRAKELIKSGERITNVYEKVGFTSSQYFSYVFKKNEGVSPSEYARKVR